MKKYNLSKIMTGAWVLYRSNNGTFSECLKKSWANEKAVCGKKKFTGTAVLEFGMATVKFSSWEGYGRKRIYINRGDGKKTYGYIDLDNCNTVVTIKNGSAGCNADYVAAFCAQYAI